MDVKPFGYSLICLVAPALVGISLPYRWKKWVSWSKLQILLGLRFLLKHCTEISTQIQKVKRIGLPCRVSPPFTVM